ncbi:MAG TPA: hypothetical protein VF939_26780 [Puia sp.]
MSHPTKPKAVFLYPLQVWLTSALIGPILWFLSPGISDHSLLTFVQFYWLALVFGFMFSFPSFLLLWAGVAYINRRTWRLLFKKLVVAGWAMSLAIAPFLLISDWREPILQGPNLAFIGSYVGPLLAAVFLFRWPEKVDS